MTTDITYLASGLHLRNPQMSDVEAVAQLTLDVCSRDGDAAVATSAADLRQSWQDPGFDLSENSWVVETADGKIVGYEELYDHHGHAALEGDGYVHPQFEGLGVGTAMLRVMEIRARQLMERAEPDLHVYIRNCMGLSDARSHEMHRNEGYLPIRYSWRMEIQLDAPPASPRWPDGVELRPYQPGEQSRAVFEAVDEAFRDHWGHTPMKYENWILRTIQRPDFDSTLSFVAWDGNQIAGVALCRLKSEIGWVGSLGVRRPWRKRGLGLSLLTHAFAEFFQRGQQTIGLGVDAESQTGATRLYQRAGMRVASQYVFYQKELRPGHDVVEDE
jgi:mycothiol synthase